jgi:hypothetical protein
MANQEKQLAVTRDHEGRPCVLVDRSRAEALRAFLAENGFSSTHVKDDVCDRLTLGAADVEEVQKLVDEWSG